MVWLFAHRLRSPDSLVRNTMEHIALVWISAYVYRRPITIIIEIVHIYGVGALFVKGTVRRESFGRYDRSVDPLWYIFIVRPTRFTSRHAPEPDDEIYDGATSTVRLLSYLSCARVIKASKAHECMRLTWITFYRSWKKNIYI